MKKLNRVLAALLVLLVMSVAVAPSVVSAKHVPADVYQVPDFKIIIIVMTVGSTDITISGKPGKIDAGPQIECDLAWAPIAPIIEALGGTITWDAATGVVTIVLGTKTIVLTIGSKYAVVNGTSILIDPKCENAPYIQEPGHTMLPVRFIAEQLGGYVAWDPTIQRVTMIFFRP